MSGEPTLCERRRDAGGLYREDGSRSTGVASEADEYENERSDDDDPINSRGRLFTATADVPCDWGCDSELCQELRREKSKRNGNEAGNSGNNESEKDEVGESFVICGRGVEEGELRTRARPPGRRKRGVASWKGASESGEFEDGWVGCWGTG